MRRGSSFGSTLKMVGRPRVGVRRQQAALLVIEKEPRALARGQRLAIDFDAGREPRR